MSEYHIHIFRCDECGLETEHYRHSMTGEVCVCGGSFRRVASRPSFDSNPSEERWQKMRECWGLPPEPEAPIPAPTATELRQKVVEYSEDAIQKEFDRGLDAIERRLAAEARMDEFDS